MIGADTLRATISGASARARRTLAAAVIGSVLLVAVAVLVLRPAAPAAPVVPATAARPASSRTAPPLPAAEPLAPAVPISLAPEPTPSSSSRPVLPPPPPIRRAPSRTPSPSLSPPPNLSLRADGDADGSTRARGTRFEAIRDGDPGTFWSPIGRRGKVSIEWARPVALTRVTVREAPGDDRIGAWELRDDDDEVLATGTGAGEIRFDQVRLRRITFVVRTASATPRIIEYETFSR